MSQTEEGHIKTENIEVRNEENAIKSLDTQKEKQDEIEKEEKHEIKSEEKSPPNNQNENAEDSPKFKIVEKEEKVEKVENDKIESVNRRKSEEKRQREYFTALRRTLNGLINKVTPKNIKTIIVELFKENLVRGRGLLVSSVLRAQDAEPKYSSLYASLIAVINTKIPNVGKLCIHRTIHQFKLCCKRNEKESALKKLQFLAQLANQDVVGLLLILQFLVYFNKNLNDDNVERMVSLLSECGEYLDYKAKGNVQTFYESLRTFVSKSVGSERMKFIVTQLLEQRRKGFPDFPAKVEMLDLVEEEDKVTHQVELTTELEIEENLNVFQFDEEFEENEKKWEFKQKEIIGEDSDEEEENGDVCNEDNQQISNNEGDKQKMEMETFDDQTGAQTIFLKKKIYITIMSCYNFEECVHKLLNLKMKEDDNKYVVEMVIECCSQEKTYKKYYGLVAERLCVLFNKFKDSFSIKFEEVYKNIHEKDMNQIRSLAMLFSHLFSSNAIEWNLFRFVIITEDETTSSSRVFLKIMLQDMFETMGMKEFTAKILGANVKEYVRGMFPTENKEDVIFAFNFFKGIGMIELAKVLQQTYLDLKEKDKKKKEEEELRNRVEIKNETSEMEEERLEEHDDQQYNYKNDKSMEEDEKQYSEEYRDLRSDHSMEEEKKDD
ncbi:cell cycle control protein cwf22, putative [Entamoeba invadens IP1]|uniref:cell cycle control protein cwf22, putative n=1 Tax=Entamoeba invadens IP1 TaxID=370355 RepID=UPI0002C3D45C|nr:cell cycle control protein cwf22, putative [Entamoeba invadens IP1]ELP85312.1 cell cycle control protein cwf22, putative [Entamoeba invadens IP1]|eukprot:XP_004184658.1 cell cycle control protein cwf22, putative [Entamoeba invadens IP1]